MINKTPNIVFLPLLVYDNGITIILLKGVFYEKKMDGRRRTVFAR
jgi:hypothetical protein